MIDIDQFFVRQGVGTKPLALLIVLPLLCISQLTAQQVYVRVSPKDCVNCNAGLFAEIINSKANFKFLFPEAYKGQRFKNFNTLYLNGKVSEKQVIFSDSLFDIAAKPLKGRSGIVVFYGKEIIFEINVEEMKRLSDRTINAILESSTQFKEILNKREKGFSTRLLMAVDYKKSVGIVADGLYRKFFLFSSTGQNRLIDLLSGPYQQLLKRILDKKRYEYYKTHLDGLKKMGKYYAEYFMPEFSNGQLIIYYQVPFIKLQKSNGNTFQGIHSPAFLAIINTNQPHWFGNLGNNMIIKNSYHLQTNEDVENRGFYPTITSPFYFDHKIYMLNQVIYTKDDVENDRDFPLLLRYGINKKNGSIEFEKYSKGLGLLKFQKDSTLNSNSLIMQIAFKSIGSYILLKDKPFVIDITHKKIIPLDWDGDLNNLHFHDKEINYVNEEVWKKDGHFVVLVKKENDYYLKLYNKNWQFKRKIWLPFYVKAIKKVRFTKKDMIIATENRILKLPNFFGTQF